MPRSASRLDLRTSSHPPLATRPCWAPLLAVCLAHAAAAEPPSVTPAPAATPAQLEQFETRVRPLLVKRCFGCHSERAESLKGGLRLDGREWVLRGGDSGAAATPGRPDDSPLVAAVEWRGFEMPPDGKLARDEIAALREWVANGLPWPGSSSPVSSGRDDPAPSPAEDLATWRRSHWSFQPLTRPLIPEVLDSSWCRGPIDRFVLSRLEQARLRPSAEAAPRALIRRMTLDVLGLPPDPAEVDVFVAAYEVDPDRAVAALVDRLLASPRYGERWGRHWLDVARYSDGFGGFLDNAELPEAWRYRDWVVDALNGDLSYGEFLRRQLAGDLLPADADGVRSEGVATGFFALGPTYVSDGGDPGSVAQARAETLADRIDTLGRGVLGLTLACARCHDHKFDPIPQQDYYSLAGVFNNTRVAEHPLASPDRVADYDERQRRIQELEREQRELADLARQEQREPTAAERERTGAIVADLERLRREQPPRYPVAHALADSGDRDMPLAIRGDLQRPGEPAPRRFLRVLAGDDPPRFATGSGRAELADAIADPANGLVARVVANRIWQHHFGQGLVRTPDNFGALGERPTHPELLDWLAAELVASGGGWKTLHRELLLSTTYRQGTAFDAECFAVDGDNRLLWRQAPRRLDVESWRDSILSSSGELDLAIGGRPVEDPRSPRRSLYLRVSRGGDRFASDELLRLFDFPLMRASVAERPTSIVPQQFLFLLNSDFMLDRARALVGRLEREAPGDAERVARAYQLLYSRPPSQDELALGLAYLATPTADGAPSAWLCYAQALLGANELMFLP